MIKSIYKKNFNSRNISMINLLCQEKYWNILLKTIIPNIFLVELLIEYHFQINRRIFYIKGLCFKKLINLKMKSDIKIKLFLYKFK